MALVKTQALSRVLLFIFCSFLANGVLAAPSTVSPSAGSTLSGSSQAFAWSAGSTDVRQWWVRAGSSAGARDYFDSGRITNAGQRSITVNNLPTNGRTVHIGLHYKTPSGAWQEVRSTYRSASTGGGASGDNAGSGGSSGDPTIASPSVGTTLAGSSQRFSWTNGSSSVQQWWFRVGSSAGGRNYYDSGRITNAGQRSVTASNLPTNGSTVYVSLFYKTATGSWQEKRFTYRAATSDGNSGSDSGGNSGGGTPPPSAGGTEPSFASPSSGAVLSGSTQRFTWNAGSSNVSQWWFRVGSSAGTSNYFDSGRITNSGQRSITVSNLPTNGRTLHVGLHYRATSGNWKVTQYTVRAASSGGNDSGGGSSGNDSGSGGSSGGSEPPPLNLSQVRWLHTDVSSWPVTARMPNVTVNSSDICMNYDKANSWPSRTIFDAALVANAWVFIWNERERAWYGATWEWFRPGQTCKKSSAVDGVHIKRGPYTASSGWEPRSGETLYFMVSGLARNSVRNVQERTRPVKVIWP